MICDLQQSESTREFFKRFSLKASRKRIPVIGCMELTARCNLNCIHCYVTKSTRRKTQNQSELSTAQWMELIDQFADAGCLFLLFTGGETMLRPDFPDIYEHACQKGLLVTVFSNATLVTDKIIDIFKAFPPHCVEISLYGASEETYEKITGVAGSFKQCIKGIYQLKEHGFNLKLKTMLLHLNCHELEEMKAFASDLDLPFRFDAAVSPRLDGDLSPIQCRVSPEAAVKKESADRDRIQQWHDFYQRAISLPSSDALYECGAGVSMFHVDAFGILRPCFMVSGAAHDLMQGRFEDLWYSKEFISFRGQGAVPVSCQACDKKPLCGYCPGFFRLETGNDRIPPAFLCEIGKHRKQMITNFESEEKYA